MSDLQNHKLVEALLKDDRATIDRLLKSAAPVQLDESLLKYLVISDKSQTIQKVLPYFSWDAINTAADYITSMSMLRLFFEHGLKINNLIKSARSSAELMKILQQVKNICGNTALSTIYSSSAVLRELLSVTARIKADHSPVCTLFFLIYKLYQQHRDKLQEKEQRNVTYLMVTCLCKSIAYFREEILDLSSDPDALAAIKYRIEQELSIENTEFIEDIIEVFTGQEELLKALFKDSLFFTRDYHTTARLLQVGASIDSINSSGETPLEVLQRSANHYSEPDKIIELLQEENDKAHPDKPIRFKTLLIKLEDLQPVISGNLFKICYNHKEYLVGSCFVNSMSMAFGFMPNFFAYFSPEEIFERLIKIYGTKQYFITFDEQDQVALSVLESNKLFLPAQSTINIIERNPLFQSSFYHNGMYYAQMLVHKNNSEFKAGESFFEDRMVICFAVDGFRPTLIYPGFQRKGSTDLIYLMDKGFSTELKLDAKEGKPFAEFLNHHYLHSCSVARQCLINAGNTPASVRECLNLIMVLSAALKDDFAGHTLNDCFEQYIGDPCAYYGITSLHRIRANIQHMLPVKSSVLDIILFAAAMISHSTLRMVNFFEIYSHLGNLMSKSYDLERIFTLPENYQPKTIDYSPISMIKPQQAS